MTNFVENYYPSNDRTFVVLPVSPIITEDVLSIPVENYIADLNPIGKPLVLSFQNNSNSPERGFLLWGLK